MSRSAFNPRNTWVSLCLTFLTPWEPRRTQVGFRAAAQNEIRRGAAATVGFAGIVVHLADFDETWVASPSG